MNSKQRANYWNANRLVSLQDSIKILEPHYPGITEQDILTASYTDAEVAAYLLGDIESDPVDPADPVDPVDPADPADPVDPVDPVQP